MHNKTEISGGERSLLGLWSNLDRDKFAPYLCLPKYGTFSKEAEKLDVTVYFSSVPKICFKNTIGIIRSILVLKNYVKTNGIKIIHSCTPRNNIISTIVGMLTGAKIIWHERVIPFGDEPDQSRKFLFLPHRVICNSNAVASRFKCKGKMPSKVRVILNGVDLNALNVHKEDKRVKEPKSKRLVGIVTNLTVRKRVEFFLDAAAKIYNKCDDVSFMVVGGEFGEESYGRIDEIKKLAVDLGIEKDMVFTGFVEEVKPYLEKFDISVNVTEKEACSRAILESMALGKPVVAMDSGGNPELLENGISGILTGPDDMESFVNSVVSLLEDKKRCLEMGSAARCRAEKLFNVERNARETEAVYRELVD